jgi:serine protease Do
MSEEKKKRKSSNLVLIVCAIIFILSMGGLVYYLFSIDQNDGQSIINSNSDEKTLIKGIEKVYDSVVVIEKIVGGNVKGTGSGFIYDSNGYILTNHHVINGADEIRIILSSGDTVKGTKIGSDEFADIGVLKIDKSYVKSVATLGSSEKMKLGQTVFTIGSPIDSSYAGTVTKGILSGKDRMVAVSVSSNSKDWIMNVMQTDAAINPGNSGGPLCNINGEVIGVNSMKIVESEIEGIGFAIPIEDAKEYADEIISGVKRKRATLGISMADLVNATSYYGTYIDYSVTSGVLVVRVTPGGSCSKVGMQPGDVITKIGDIKVNNVAELRYYLYKHSPGETINVTFKRMKNEYTVQVTLGEN